MPVCTKPINANYPGHEALNHKLNELFDEVEVYALETNRHKDRGEGYSVAIRFIEPYGHNSTELGERLYVDPYTLTGSDYSFSFETMQDGGH